MRAHAAQPEIEAVCERIRSLGFQPHIIPGEQRTAIGITGNSGPIDPAEFADFSSVADAIRVSKPYKLVSRETKPENTVVHVHGVPIGGDSLVICGGPCAVENREQILTSAR
jgi:3-deoxy-7-phosphoheptulonate synthase